MVDLVANVWPVVDSRTKLVLRYFIRAYLIPPPDSSIATTLRTLAPTDFRLAQGFPIPQYCKVISEHGTIDGCVTIGDFLEHLPLILEPTLREVEMTYAKLQGIGVLDGQVTGIDLIPRFPQDPYLVITPLLEMPDGQLVPQVQAQERDA